MICHAILPGRDHGQRLPRVTKALDRHGVGESL